RGRWRGSRSPRARTTGSLGSPGRSPIWRGRWRGGRSTSPKRSSTGASTGRWGGWRRPRLYDATPGVRIFLSKSGNLGYNGPSPPRIGIIRRLSSIVPIQDEPHSFLPEVPPAQPDGGSADSFRSLRTADTGETPMRTVLKLGLRFVLV